MFAVGFIADFLFILIPFAWVLWETKARPNSVENLKQAGNKLGFKKISPGKLAKHTLILFFILVISAILLSLTFTAFQANDLNKVAKGLEYLRGIGPVALTIIILFRVIGEEVFFRGLLVPRIGVFGSAAVFALIHIGYGSWTEIAGVFALGLILAIAFKEKGNIYTLITAHFVYNLFVFAYIFGWF